MWDGDGRVLLANGALDRLWGGEPSLAEVEAVTGTAPGRDEASRGEVERAGRALEVELRALEAGTLGLIRDVSARRELDRRRRETQRLVSHELKTPLASISGFGAMLERYALDREEQLRVAGLIRGEADRLGRMVATFLDLERLGSGRLEAARAPVDLAALTERRCELLAAAAAGRSQTLEVMVQRATVLGAEELLDRLLDNLVGNALKYSPPGSTVTVQLTEGAGSIVLAVRDHGPGIPPAAIPHLFERFFRVPGTEAAGSGLGLALVREVAEWHGAEVHVDSEPGRGSTFTVLFNAAHEGS